MSECVVCGDPPVVGDLCAACWVIANLTDRQVEAVCDRIETDRMEVQNGDSCGDVA